MAELQIQMVKEDNPELHKIIWKKVILSYFKVLFQYL